MRTKSFLLNVQSICRLPLFLLLMFFTPVLALAQSEPNRCHGFFAYGSTLLNSGEQVSFCEAYEGKVVVVVNTASKCAFTRQYEGLEALYSQYKDQGLVVLGFPSNQFGGQEPGTEAQIQDFCRVTYGVEFPMMSKTEVVGDNAAPVWSFLQQETDTTPKWNFYKYIVDRDGKVVDVFGSMTSPTDETFLKRVTGLL